MEMFVKEFIVPIAIVTGIVGSVGIATLIIVLRDRISGIFLSRTGLQIHTTDVMGWCKTIIKIDYIDTTTRKSIRKATMRLMILDPEKYGTTVEVMLVNREANLSLIYAAYENHHTRELSAEGADVYMASKANDISEAVWVWKRQFPELTDELSEKYACHWIRKILIPNIRKACYDKLAYYESVHERKNINKILKDEIARCINKNLKYIADIDALAARIGLNERIQESGIRREESHPCLLTSDSLTLTPNPLLS
jgi:hypothetical protein